MFLGPRITTVFASRWKALGWSAGVLMTAYCSIPSADQTGDQAADQAGVNSASPSADSQASPWALASPSPATGR